jgi:hypothetical protein
MKQNTAGQVASAWVYNTDRTPYNGATTVYVTIDNGTQTVGTVSSGAGTSKGHGEHTYLPSQAETNGNTIKFTFVGTSNAQGEVQYTTSILTGDAYARLGPPVTTTISNDIQVRPTTPMVESYAAKGAQYTMEQAQYMQTQFLHRLFANGTTVTIKGLNGETTVMTFVTDTADNPKTINRIS